MTAPLTPELQIGTTRRGYLVALGLVVASIAIVGIGMWRISDNVAAMPRVEARGTHVVDLPSGDLTVFGELEGGNAVASFQCAAKDAAGSPLALTQPSGKTTYDMGSHHGESVFELSVPKAGPVTIKCETDADLTLAFGNGLGTALVLTVLPSLFAFFSGCFVAVRTFRRRRRERKARSTAP